MDAAHGAAKRVLDGRGAACGKNKVGSERGRLPPPALPAQQAGAAYAPLLQKAQMYFVGRGASQRRAPAGNAPAARWAVGASQAAEGRGGEHPVPLWPGSSLSGSGSSAP
jgi:hypothetical protein